MGMLNVSKLSSVLHIDQLVWMQFCAHFFKRSIYSSKTGERVVIKPRNRVFIVIASAGKQNGLVLVII